MAAFNQAGRQTEAAAEGKFAGVHFAVIAFVVHARKVKQTVEQQDAELGGKRVAVVAGLAECGIDGDGQIAGNAAGRK